jgi:hypothetical protein
LEVGRGIDTFVFVPAGAFDRASCGSRGAEGVTEVGSQAKVFSCQVAKLDLSGSCISLSVSVTIAGGRGLETLSMRVKGRSGFAAFTTCSDFIGTQGATNGVASRMSRSTTYTFTLSSNLVASTSLGAWSITSFGDPVVVLSRRACGTFRSIVDLTSSGAGALTVFTADEVRFATYAVGVVFVGFGAFGFTSSVVGIGSFGGIVALTLTVHLE